MLIVLANTITHTYTCRWWWWVTMNADEFKTRRQSSHPQHEKDENIEIKMKCVVECKNQSYCSSSWNADKCIASPFELETRKRWRWQKHAHESSVHHEIFVAISPNLIFCVHLALVFSGYVRRIQYSRLWNVVMWMTSMDVVSTATSTHHHISVLLARHHYSGRWQDITTRTCVTFYSNIVLSQHQ